MGPLDSTIVSVSLPTMSSDLNMDYATSIWVPTAYLVAVCALLLTVGRLLRYRGRKTIFISGFSLFVVGSFLCSIATSGAELIAFRVLQGSGAAFIMADVDGNSYRCLPKQGPRESSGHKCHGNISRSIHRSCPWGHSYGRVRMALDIFSECSDRDSH